jgi:pilus assembly protein CpaE
MIDVIRRTVPVVVIDLPSTWMPWTRAVVGQADEVVVVATPELASLRNAKNIIDLLKASRPNDRPPLLLLNQTGIAKRPEIPVADFAKAVGIEPSYIVAFDPVTFGTAAGNGRMIAEVNAKSKAVEQINALSERVAGRQAPAPKSRFKFPLLGKLSLTRKK